MDGEARKMSVKTCDNCNRGHDEEIVISSYRLLELRSLPRDIDKWVMGDMMDLCQDCHKSYILDSIHHLEFIPPGNK